MGYFEQNECWIVHIGLVAIDKDVSRDLIDGLRDLRLQRPKRAKEKYLSVGGVQQGLVRPVQMVHARDEDDSSESEWSDEETEEDDSESKAGEISMVTSVTDSSSVTTEEDEGAFSDVESVYRYPYDINRMRVSSPLKGVVSINNVPIECVFDSGASVSVISKHLCEEVLGLVPNGDNLQLVGFDNKHTGVSSNIVMDVPIKIGGKVRPEHMCVQDTGKNDRLCLLGVPWFQAYGIQMDLVNSLVRVPTTNGILSLQCYTTHLPSSLVIQRRAGLVNSRDTVSLNDRFKKLNDNERRKKAQQVYSVQVAQKYCESLEDDMIPDDPLGETSMAVDEIKYDASNISEGVLDELKPLVEEYKDCFSEVSGLTKIKGYSLDIQLKEDARPIRSKSFRLTWEEEDIMNSYLDEMLELDLIEESDGVWTSPCFLVPKKDGSKRCVIDYRRVNEMLVQTNYPMATVGELTEATAGAMYYTSLDLSSGYHQLEINPDSDARKVTGFITKRGVFQYKVLPMGISIGCSEFQRVISSIFKDYIGVFLYVFLDDVLLYSRTLEEHKEHLKLMFEACRKANLKLKRKKCFFAKESVEYLGHNISRSGTSPSERNVEKVKNFPPCSDASQLKSFLGLASFMRKYMPNFSSEVASLVKLTRKNAQFVWGEEQMAAFNKVKQMLCNAPVLAYPDRNKYQILSVDASHKGLGAVLSQCDSENDEESERILGYASRGLSRTEQNWHIHELETFAVVWGMNHFKHYLKGRRFALITDHSSLVYIFRPNKTTPKLTRWCAAVLEYSFDIYYRSGIKNIADPLSRVPIEHWRNMMMELEDDPEVRMVEIQHKAKELALDAKMGILTYDDM